MAQKVINLLLIISIILSHIFMYKLGTSDQFHKDNKEFLKLSETHLICMKQNELMQKLILSFYKK